MGGRGTVGWVGGRQVEAPKKERMGTLCYFWGNSSSPVSETRLSSPNDLLSAPSKDSVLKVPRTAREAKAGGKVEWARREAGLKPPHSQGLSGFRNLGKARQGG